MDTNGEDGINSNNNGGRGNWALKMFRSSKNSRILRLRHRLLWDLMQHSNFFCKEAAGVEECRTLHLRELLARMGFPFEQCCQPWAFVGPGMRRRLGGLTPTICDSVKFLLSMVDAVLTLLDVPRKEEMVPIAAGKCCQYNMRMRIPHVCQMRCCAQQHQGSNDG